MINFSTCDRHADCLIVFDNISGCPVCKMAEEITDMLAVKAPAKEKLQIIKEALI